MEVFVSCSSSVSKSINLIRLVLLRNHQTVGPLLVLRILLLLLVVLFVVLAVNGLAVGPIPTEVGQLDKLSALRLENNRLTGKNKVSDVVVDVGCDAPNN